MKKYNAERSNIIPFIEYATREMTLDEIEKELGYKEMLSAER